MNYFLALCWVVATVVYATVMIVCLMVFSILSFAFKIINYIVQGIVDLLLMVDNYLNRIQEKIDQR